MLTPVQQNRFTQQGYPIVRNVIDPVDGLDPIVREYDILLDALAGRLVSEGWINPTIRDRSSAACRVQ